MFAIILKYCCFTFCRFLKQKKDSDPNFVNFIEQRRGADTHTLESLLLLPVSRINEYDRILGQLLDLTPQDHTDYSYLKEAYDKMHFVRFLIATVLHRHRHMY